MKICSQNCYVTVQGDQLLRQLKGVLQELHNHVGKRSLLLQAILYSDGIKMIRRGP